MSMRLLTLLTRRNAPIIYHLEDAQAATEIPQCAFLFFFPYISVFIRVAVKGLVSRNAARMSMVVKLLTTD